MFWNLENFFYPAKEETIQDNPKTVTWKRFRAKRDLISKTVIAIKDKEGAYPSLIGVCEVENIKTLKNLVFQDKGYTLRKTLFTIHNGYCSYLCQPLAFKTWRRKEILSKEGRGSSPSQKTDRFNQGVNPSSDHNRDGGFQRRPFF